MLYAWLTDWRGGSDKSAGKSRAEAAHQNRYLDIRSSSVMLKAGEVVQSMAISLTPFNHDQ